LCKHIWNALPRNIFGGSKCPNCHGEGISNDVVIEDNAKSFNEKISGNVYILVYNGYKEQSEAYCNSCKHRWFVQPRSVYKSFEKNGEANCPKCHNSTATTSEFTKIMDELSLWTTTTTVPKTSYDKTEFICLICQKRYFSSINKLKEGYGCRYCEKDNDDRIIKYECYAKYNNLKYKSESKTKEIKRFNKTYNRCTIIYRHHVSHIWTCPKGHIYEDGPNLYNIKKGKWCEDCNNKCLYNTYILYEIAEKFKIIYCGGPYKGYNFRHTWRCPDCNCYIIKSVKEFVNGDRKSVV